jgi:riboflavin kinase/FMN adenylyltransferase
MIVARSLAELRKEDSSVVTVGTFDGVHRAHREIVREVVHRAKMGEGRSVVVTFEPHPKEVVPSAKGPVALLTTIDERMEHLTALGVDVLLVIEFTLEFSRLSSRAFYEQYLVRGIGVREVVVGYDHTFGHNREGRAEELIAMGKEFNFSVFALHPFSVAGEVVSSTRIRKALAEGGIEHANTLLGWEYSLRGIVIRGDGRGRTLGYPTANIQPQSDKKLIPATGVYLVAVAMDGRNTFGMMNIGIRPTVTDARRMTMEVHLFDFSEDVYGKPLTIKFLKRLRDEKKFPSLAALAEQLGKDKTEAQRILAGQLERQQQSSQSI